jgi:SpoVK/Ycf46/Vps4 family AAA+-type ATPase
VTVNSKPIESSSHHLREELALIELRIKRQIAVMKAANPSGNTFDEFSGMYISEDEIKNYLDRETKPGNTNRVGDHKTVKALSEEIDRRRKELDLRVAAALEKGVRLRLVQLKERFLLTETELDMVVCCLAPDVDIRFDRYFAYLQNDVSKRRPTVQLLSGMFLGAVGEQDTVLASRGVFNRETGILSKHLFNLDISGNKDETPFPAKQFAVADSVLDFLLESDHLDAAVARIGKLSEGRPMEMYAGYFDRHVQVLDTLARHYQDHGSLPAVYIGGPGGAGKSRLVSTFAAALDKKVLKVDYHGLMSFQGDIRQILALVEREARLHDAFLQIHLLHSDEWTLNINGNMNGDRPKTVLLNNFLQENQLAGIVLTGSEEYSRIKDRIPAAAMSFYIPMPTVEERFELWNRLLASDSPEEEQEWISGLAVKFRFTPGRIRSVLDAASLMARVDEENKPVVELADIYRCCRDESDQGLLSYSQKIVPHYRWQDIVLPDDTMAQLKEICDSVRNRRKVFWEWGFEQKFSLGKGLNILLAGPPGIGKTMSAEIIAGELGLDLYKIDLSCVVSKYIGETEKNLSKIFREAETSNCILFFDEADALFGKRTEVRDSHDRYANIEINFLLQKMDEYDGIVLMATNMRKNLDTAFTRRLHHVVEFPFPDEKYRGIIWKNAFPADTPIAENIDFQFLAGKFKISGGNIKNIAVNSAFLASSNGGKVNMENIILAVKREYQKMGKMCSKSEFGQYYNLVREVHQ